jgi:hypothetical protein
MLGVDLSKSAGKSTKGGYDTRGWKLTSVDRKGNKALSSGGRVHTPAEAVLMSYRDGSTWSSTKAPAMAKHDEELPKILSQLSSHGFTVEPTAGGHLITRQI